MRTGGSKPFFFFNFLCTSIYLFFLARLKGLYYFFPKYLESFLVTFCPKSSLVEKRIKYMDPIPKTELLCISCKCLIKVMSFVSSPCPLELLMTLISKGFLLRIKHRDTIFCSVSKVIDLSEYIELNHHSLVW